MVMIIIVIMIMIVVTVSAVSRVSRWLSSLRARVCVICRVCFRDQNMGLGAHLKWEHIVRDFVHCSNSCWDILRFYPEAQFRSWILWTIFRPLMIVAFPGQSPHPETPHPWTHKTHTICAKTCVTPIYMYIYIYIYYRERDTYIYIYTYIYIV